MINRLFLALTVLLAGSALGLGLGLYVGWEVWPVAYQNTDVTSLRQDFKDDYVVLVATTYAWEGDLVRARERLEHLQAGSPAQVLAQTAARLERRAAPAADLQRLNRLALDLRSGGSVPAPGP